MIVKPSATDLSPGIAFHDFRGRDLYYVEFYMKYVTVIRVQILEWMPS